MRKLGCSSEAHCWTLSTPVFFGWGFSPVCASEKLPYGSARRFSHEARNLGESQRTPSDHKKEQTESTGRGKVPIDRCTVSSGPNRARLKSRDGWTEDPCHPTRSGWFGLRPSHYPAVGWIVSGRGMGQ